VACIFAIGFKIGELAQNATLQAQRDSFQVAGNTIGQGQSLTIRRQSIGLTKMNWSISV
jgi:hypothetical protein